MVTIVPMPASRARASTASRSESKSGKSRWQWLSTSIPLAGQRGCFVALEIAREDALRCRQRRARLQPASGTERRELARACREREQIEELRCRRRHRRLDQDRDLTQDLGG